MDAKLVSMLQKKADLQDDISKPSSQKKQEAQLPQRDRTTRYFDLKSCQLLQNCTNKKC